MPYNVVSSLCIADPSPMGSAIFWAHVNKIKINKGKKDNKQTFWIQNLFADGVPLVVANVYNSNTKIIAVSKYFT